MKNKKILSVIGIFIVAIAIAYFIKNSGDKNLSDKDVEVKELEKSNTAKDQKSSKGDQTPGDEKAAEDEKATEDEKAAEEEKATEDEKVAEPGKDNDDTETEKDDETDSGDVEFNLSSYDDYKALLSDDKPDIIMFGAGYCHFCEQMKPYVQKMANLYRNKVNIRFVDVQENPDIALEYPAQQIPSVAYLLKDGKPYMPSEELKKLNFYPYAKKGSDEVVLTMSIGLISEANFKRIVEEVISVDQ